MAAAAQAEDERADAGQALAAAPRARPLRRDRARRQYQLAEPENRLVTRQLEARLGSRARRAAAAGGGVPAVHRADARPAVTRRARRDPGALAADLPQVWDAADDHAGRPQEAAARLIESVQSPSRAPPSACTSPSPGPAATRRTPASGARWPGSTSWSESKTLAGQAAAADGAERRRLFGLGGLAGLGDGQFAGVRVGLRGSMVTL